MKSKLDVAKRELDEAINTLTALQKKLEAEGKPGLTKNFEFCLKELKFAAKRVIYDLEEEA